ncbi:hypothetical protein SPRG_01323 [Saprolegnia parasitica CBS 223.65]|uniref:Uncharacterized protein n=1 Tax=Saprolegnia parasitica (strain CBS 223.65) TaxID=695850 RepID=A0A067CTL6_SAPPC|nr:hypothetical protein SPRG_01323 [Saprolegnia parasitica CBS 223.65]KDO34049.1 hypothetical protein SPRG_01323 [Saprolegnia parasitica CBS 223.65]|eukprot:XP_012194933.1 hypothetical protein SPRG_01323 [Saprolegnia parasitica CBS 223.65]
MSGSRVKPIAAAYEAVLAHLDDGRTDALPQLLAAVAAQPKQYDSIFDIALVRAPRAKAPAKHTAECLAWQEREAVEAREWAARPRAKDVPPGEAAPWGYEPGHFDYAGGATFRMPRDPADGFYTGDTSADDMQSEPDNNGYDVEWPDDPYNEFSLCDVTDKNTCDLDDPRAVDDDEGWDGDISDTDDDDDDGHGDDTVDCYCHESPELQTRRRISVVQLHASSASVPLAVTDALVGRAVGRWITTRSLQQLSSAILVFWPTRHRPRFVGLEPAMRALHAGDALGFPCTDDLARGVIDMFGSTDGYKTTEADATAMASYLLQSSSSSSLPGLFLPDAFTLDKRASRRRGLHWLRDVVAKFGWSSISDSVVSLCTLTSPDHGLYRLAHAMHFARKLLLDTVVPVHETEVVADLLQRTWRVLSTQLTAVHAIDEYPNAMPIRFHIVLLQDALIMEARAGRLQDIPAGGPMSIVLAWTRMIYVPNHVLSVLLPVLLTVQPPDLVAELVPTVADTIEYLTDKDQSHLADVFRFHARYRDVVSSYHDVANVIDVNAFAPFLKALRAGMVVASPNRIVDDVVQRTLRLLAGTLARTNDAVTGRVLTTHKPVIHVPEAIATCHLLSPPAVTRLLDEVTALVTNAPDALYYVRRVLYPMVQYLDSQLPGEYPLPRSAMAAAVRTALVAFLQATQTPAPTPQLHSLCHCRECNEVKLQLEACQPTRDVDVVRVTCPKLRAAVGALPPHPRVALALLSMSRLSIRISSEAAAAAEKQRDEATAARLRAGKHKKKSKKSKKGKSTAVATSGESAENSFGASSLSL